MRNSFLKMSNYRIYQSFFIFGFIIAIHVISAVENDQTYDYDDYDYYDNTSICEQQQSSTSVFHFLNNLYEENKDQSIVKHVNNFNDTMAIIDHVVMIVEKIINIEIDPKQMMILADIIINTNISNDCLWSLAKISTGIFDRQIWALKCKMFRMFFVEFLKLIFFPNSFGCNGKISDRYCRRFIFTFR